jgi:aromatic-amino-acid transaminase
MVLSTPELRQLWEEELAGMRVRIKEMRNLMVEKLKEKAPGQDFEFVREQVGMFSYSGLSKEQVGKLREQSIYAVDTGRICVAALNSTNLERVVDAVAKVL